MSQYIVSKNYPASYEEQERWGTESSYFNFQPGNRHAPKGTHEHKGWGIQEEILPPDDAYAWVASRFIAGIAKYPRNDDDGNQFEIRPQYKWSILSTLMAHFLWFHEKDGAEYVAGLYNMEEVPDFFPGYTYFYTEANTKNTKRITSRSEWNLRIWRTIDPEVKTDKLPPIVLPDESNMIQMQTLLSDVRNPYGNGENPVAGDEMYEWISHQLHLWMISDAGDRWIRTHQRSPGVPFYSFIGNLELFGRKSFRMKDLQGNVVWCGPADMKAVPDRDLLTHNLPQGWTQQDVINMYQCACCGKERNCLPLTGDQKLCAWCYGTTVERDQRPTLEYCTRSECGGRSSTCPSYISTNGELVNLKSRLNRGSRYPVYRDEEGYENREY